MQVSVETTSGLERRLTIAVPAADVDGKVNAKLAEVAKTAKVNGFRKGKVPLKIIDQQYGEAARQEVASDLINSAYMQAIEQESVRPVGYPKIEVNTIAAGKGLEFVAIIEVYPEVELGEFDGYELTRLTADILDADVDKAIESLREQQASFGKVERAAVSGDQATIDFTGTKDGEEFQGGKGDDFKLVLGSNSMIPGFEDGVVGMKSGEAKTLELTFPEDYQVDDLKGADVKFDVTLNKVEEKSLPEIDDDFMKHFGSDSTESFRSEIKKNMERELKRAVQGKLKASVMDNLVENHKVELPKALIESEIDALREQMMKQFGGIQQNKSLDLKTLLPDEMFAEQAERRVSLGIIIGEVVKKNDIKVDAQKVRAHIDEAASSYDKPQEVVDYYYQNQQMLSGVESVVLEDMVVDSILEQAKVSDKAVDYDEAIAQPQV
ncbi:MAG: trigger factor [Cellvibrionaceae bacterium]|jgi:trigger factor